MYFKKPAFNNQDHSNHQAVSKSLNLEPFFYVQNSQVNYVNGQKLR